MIVMRWSVLLYVLWISVLPCYGRSTDATGATTDGADATDYPDTTLSPDELVYRNWLATVVDLDAELRTWKEQKSSFEQLINETERIEAEAAEKEENVKGELKELQEKLEIAEEDLAESENASKIVEVYKQQVSQLQKRINETSKIGPKMDSREIHLSNELDKLDKLIGEKENSTTKLEVKKKKCDSELSKLKNLSDSKTNELEGQNQTVAKRLIKELEELDAQKDNITAKIRVIEGRIKDMGDNREKLSKNRTKYAEELEVITKNKTLVKELESQKKELELKIIREQSKSKFFNVTKAVVDKLKGNKTNLESKRKEAETAKINATADLENLRKNLTEAEAKMTMVNQEKEDRAKAAEKASNGTTEDTNAVETTESAATGYEFKLWHVGALVGSLVLAAIVIGAVVLLCKQCSKDKEKTAIEPAVDKPAQSPANLAPSNIPPTAPTDVAPSVPADIPAPVPTNAAAPAPTDAAAPASADVAAPAPADVAAPAPTDAAAPTPADVPAPAPTDAAAPAPADVAASPAVAPAPNPDPAAVGIPDCTPFDAPPVPITELTLKNAVFLEVDAPEWMEVAKDPASLPPPAIYSTTDVASTTNSAAAISFSNTIYRKTVRRCSILGDNGAVTGIEAPKRVDKWYAPPWKKQMEKALKEAKPAEKVPKDLAAIISLNNCFVISMARNEMEYTSAEEFIWLLDQAKDKMLALPTMTTLPGHTVVISSLEGHVPHLIRILALFDKSTTPNNICTANIVFNGNAINHGVARGSMVCLCYILTLIAISPKKVVFLRGLWESNSEFIDDIGGEIKKKFEDENGSKILTKMWEFFNALPLMARVEGHLVLPGGPPKKQFTMEELKDTKRPINNPFDHPITSGTMASIPETHHQPYSEMPKKDLGKGQSKSCRSVRAGPDEPADLHFANSIVYGEKQVKELCATVNCRSLITGSGETQGEAYHLEPGTPGSPPVLISKSGRFHHPSFVYVDEAGTGHIVVAAKPEHPLDCCGVFESGRSAVVNEVSEGGKQIGEVCPSDAPSGMSNWG